MSQPTTDVTAPMNDKAVFDNAALASITDFNAVINLFNERGIVPESMKDYGTGFEIVKDKATLVGVPFVILDWRYNKSDHDADRPFVSAAIVTKDGRKLILNDGGTGICDQLSLVTQQRRSAGHPHPQAGLVVNEGLTRSDYTYINDKGKQSQATTYYLAEV